MEWMNQEALSLSNRWRKWTLLAVIGVVIVSSLWTIGELYRIVPANYALPQETAGIALASANSDSSLQYSDQRSKQRLEATQLLEARRGENVQRDIVERSYNGAAGQLGCLQRLALLYSSSILAHEACKRAIEKEETDDSSSNQSGESSSYSYAGQVYLTFDDGPSKLTASILDLLAESSIRATFFVLGEKVVQYPELAQRIVKEGHSIGNHSYNHVYQELYQRPDLFVDQVVDTASAIYEATGVVPYLFRAPGGTYGNFDSSYLKAVESAGYAIYDWNVDSGDSRSRDVTAEEMLTTIKGSPISERMIVLLHDSATHAETVAALPDIIAYFQSLNYEFLAITEETTPITSRLSESIKWDRKVMNEKQAKQLKEQMEQLRQQAASAPNNR